MNEIEKIVAVFWFVVCLFIMVLGFSLNNDRFDKIEKELHELKTK